MKRTAVFGLQEALHAALILLLVATGVLAWTLQSRPPLEVDASPLADLPTRSGPFQAEDIPVESAVEQILRADFNLQRAYVALDNIPVWLYIGYYGTTRGGRPEHSPRGCYTGAGWGIERARVVETGGQRGVRANEWIVERQGQRRLVLFWFRSHRRSGMIGGIDVSIDRLVGRLKEGRADGALIRVSTPLNNDEDMARIRVRQLATALDLQLDDHWPLENVPPV